MISIWVWQHQHRHYHLIIPHFLLLAGLFPLSYTMMLFNTYHVSQEEFENRYGFSGYIIWDQINSTQWYQVYVREIKRRWISPSETESYRLMLLHKEKKNGRRRQQKERALQYESWHSNYSTEGDKILSMYPFQWASCHIQYTYNSSHKINLFSLQFKIKQL